MKKILINIIFALAAFPSFSQQYEWMETAPEYTFTMADNVSRQKVHFKNRFNIDICGDIYIPLSAKANEPLPAIIVSGPYGAVKEQASGIYADKLASEGFITLAFDPSYTGESGGEPRGMSSPDIYTDDYSAAVDFLAHMNGVDAENIGVIGICGLGGISLNAAQSDPRIKAVLGASPTNMHRVQSQGMFDSSNTSDDRKSRRKRDAEMRTKFFGMNERPTDGGVQTDCPEGTAQYQIDYRDYYKTPRGYARRSPNSNQGMDATAWISWVNTPIVERLGEIDADVMIMAGENAHTRYMGEDMFSKLIGGDKQLVIVPDAVHCDLYDGGPNHDKIPWETVVKFFKSALVK